MSELEEPGDAAPGAATIVKSAALALVASLIATILFILPAEYGIDPTGAGEKLGLLALAETVAAPAEPVRLIVGDYPAIPDDFDFYEPEVLGEPFSKGHAAPFRTDEFVIRLEEFEQVEYKAIMRRGDAIVYSWSVDSGIVYSDFHADPGEDAEGYPDQYFIRYREAEVDSDSGSLVAPFDGNHGWYWLNIEEKPIVITLRTAGYYDRIDELFRSFQ